MNTAPDHETISQLASASRRLGIAMLILAALSLILAFTGYETPRPVNLFHLLAGVNLILLGSLCISLGKAFANASGDTIPESLGTALNLSIRFFGYLTVLTALAIVGVGFDTLVFLNKILARLSGA